MASRKEEKQRLRREREERERAAADAQRRKRLIGYGAGGALALAAVVVLAVMLLSGGGEGGGGGGGGESALLPSGGRVAELKETDVARAAKAGGCELKARKARSREHTSDPAEALTYDTNPPMSGRHYEVAADDRAYTEAPSDASAVHALEHGRVNVWFKPTAPRPVRADLKALYDRDQGFQMLLIPRPDMPYQVAASAWAADPQPLGTGRLIGCPTANAESLEAVQAFIEEHRGNGPEPVP